MIPDKVKVSGMIYDVQVTNDILLVGGRECKGRIQYEKQIIELSDNIQNEQGREQTWWHEVVHAICIDRDLDFDDENEEVVDKLAKALYALMKDNKFPLPGQLLGVNEDAVQIGSTEKVLQCEQGEPPEEGCEC